MDQKKAIRIEILDGALYLSDARLCRSTATFVRSFAVSIRVDAYARSFTDSLLLLLARPRENIKTSSVSLAPPSPSRQFVRYREIYKMHRRYVMFYVRVAQMFFFLHFLLQFFTQANDSLN